MSFDYNTSRKRMVLPEYGRNIQKMVDHLKTIEDREKRNRLAQLVVNVMGNLNPHLRDINDFKHKLWDHIAIISNFELDIDFPYEIPQKETFERKPDQVPYGTHTIRYRHYGYAVEEMAKNLKGQPDSPERKKKIEVLANQMKKSYLAWNRDTVDDEVILKDLANYLGDSIDISDIQLAESKELISRPNKRPQQQQHQHHAGGKRNQKKR